jgi:hypothetical protein
LAHAINASAFIYWQPTPGMHASCATATVKLGGAL